MTPQTPVSILDYSDFATFLRDFVASKKSTRATYNFRNIAKRAGINSPSLMTMIVKGERLPTPDTLERLCIEMKLTKAETAFAITLVAFRRASTASEKAHYAEQLAAARPRNDELRLEVHQLRLFSNWAYAALLMLLQLPGTRRDPEWLSARLGQHLNPHEVELAIALLVEIGLVRRGDDNSLAVTDRHLESPTNVPVEVVRDWNKAMMVKAAAAVDNQSVNERFITGSTLTFEKSKIAEAQSYLAEVHKEFRRRFASANPDEVYQLSTQFFRITEDV